MSSEVITIEVASKFLGELYGEIRFAIKRKTKLKRVVSEYTNRHGVKDGTILHFTFNGKLIYDTDTAESINIEDGGRIICHDMPYSEHGGGICTSGTDNMKQADTSINEDKQGDDDGSEQEDFPEFDQQDNLRIWNGIKTNDPDIANLHISLNEVDTGIDWSKKARYLSSNTNLKQIKINGMINGIQEEIPHELSAGISQNRSIEYMAFDYCRGGHQFPQFFESNHNLRRIDFNYCNRNFVTTILSRCNKTSLRTLKIQGFNMRYDIWQDNDLWNSNEESANPYLIELINEHQNITRLSLRLNNSSDSSLISAYIGVLQPPALQNVDLDLRENKIDDEGIITIANWMIQNKLVKKLCLADNPSITAAGWVAFFNRLSVCQTQLKELNLDENHIDNEGMTSLGRALTNNSELTVFSFIDCIYFTGEGTNAFLESVQRSGIAMKELKLDTSVTVNDDVLYKLENFMKNNTSLKSLSLPLSIRTTGQVLCPFSSTLEKLCIEYKGEDDGGVAALGRWVGKSTCLKDFTLHAAYATPAVWIQLFNAMQNSNTLEILCLRNNRGINDDAMAALVDSLSNISSLTMLDLLNCAAITTVGWQAFALLLQSTTCKLSEINEAFCRTDDDIMMAFATALIDNKCLSSLVMGDIHNRSENGETITERGWSALVNVLYDKSSIEATHSSNHTLQQICYRHDEDRLPNNVLAALRLNRNGGTKTEVAREKILRCHMLTTNSVNSEAFVDLDAYVLPSAISWLGRDYIGHSALYQLFRSLPGLLERNKPVAASQQLKRKRN